MISKLTMVWWSLSAGVNISLLLPKSGIWGSIMFALYTSWDQREKRIKILTYLRARM